MGSTLGYGGNKEFHQKPNDLKARMLKQDSFARIEFECQHHIYLLLLFRNHQTSVKYCWLSGKIKLTVCLLNRIIKYH